MAVDLRATRLSTCLHTVALVVLLLHLSVSASGQGEAVVVYVDNETGRDDSCWPPHQDTPCTSLEAIASGITSMENLTSLEIAIRSPQLELKEPVKFEGLSVVRIVGAPTQIQCVSNSSTETSGNSTAGVVFVAIENLFIEDIVFKHCGTFYNYPKRWESESLMPFRAAIHIFNATNILAKRTVVSASNGAGMAVSNVHGGTLNVSDSHFEHNAIPAQDKDSDAGGGGIFVQVRQPIASPSTYVFNNCTFINNTASTTRDSYFANVFGSIVTGRGLGGGLTIRILNEATNNSIAIANCKFVRNSAIVGGGLELRIDYHSRNNLVVVKDSYFDENGCEPGLESWSGGGLHIGYSYSRDDREHARDNMIVIKDSIFTRNCAETGGGTTFYSSRSLYPEYSNGMQFINCSWIENSGRIGAAIDISPNSDHRLLGGFLPRPELTDCRFINNSAAFRSIGQEQASGTGTLFSSLIDIKFISLVHFEHNSDSALIVVDAVADFSSCNATFVNNTGVQGGAISLIGVSSMVIGPGHVYQFLNNRATDRGGAISSYLIDEHDFAASRTCFIQYTERIHPTKWNSTLIFMGNEAPIGRSIFITAITSCLLDDILLSLRTEQQSVTLDPAVVFQWPGVISFDEPGENQIATDGAHFGILGKVPFEIIPGEEHLLQVNITDDLGQLVDTALRATIDNQEKSDIEIEAAFSYVEDKHVQLRGEVGKGGDLVLQFVSPRKTSMSLDFVLVPCPVGYSLNSEKECECDVNSYEGLTKCHTSSLTAYIREGLWAGYMGGALVTAICPVEFCRYNDSDKVADVLLPRTSSNVVIDNFICGPSRTGVLCGDCTEGYSAYYHSPYFSCQENKLCIIGWLLYILSELVPATFLFVFILFFNIKFTSGKLNGFIFFSQILSTLFVDATDVIKVPDAVHVLSWGYQIIYGFFSLDFFTIEPLSFCLWEGATVLDVLAFKYVTIAYSLILVILVIVFMKYFARRLLGNRIKISPIETSVIHGISAFLVVCYMQCIKISLKILLSRSLQGRGGTLLSPARVWFNGEIEVFSPDHLPYAIPALLCLLTLGIIPPILLLVYPLNYRIAAFFNINSETYPKLSRLTMKIAFNKLKPVLDSFQGCFKDDFRLFAGLYFVYRWVGLLAYAVSPTLRGFYATLQVMLTLMLLIHAVAQPYENRWYNTVDAFLLTDLALINMLTVFNYYYTRVTAEEVRDQQVIDVTSSFQLILIYLPILAMCVYLMVKGIKKFQSRKKVTKTDDTMEENSSLHHSAITKRRHVTTSDIGSLDDLPARLLVEYHELEPEEEETTHMSHGLPPNIPPAYDPQ